MWPAPGAAARVYFYITITASCCFVSWFPEAPWEEGEIHPACSCDHRLWTDRTHFPGRTVTRGAPAMFSQPIFLPVCLAEQGCCFPSCGHTSCIGLRPHRLVLSYSHCVITLFSLMSTFCVFLKLYRTKNLTRQNSFAFFWIICTQDMLRPKGWKDSASPN